MADLNFMEFHQLPPTSTPRPQLRGLPLTMRHPQILIHFCEKGHKECRNDYMKPFPTLKFCEKSKITDHPHDPVSGSGL